MNPSVQFATGLVFMVFITLLSATTADPEPSRNGKRKGKLFSVFQVIRFNNDACDGGSRNGTCYTEPECEAKGGTNSGSCADGFGVCCTFTVNCGEMSNENCTYFESNSPTAGGCSAKICPCNNNICQLRLDFTSFSIAGPSTSTISTAKYLNGIAVENQGSTNGVSGSVASRCLTDSFAVANAAGKSSDILCGINIGQHMYVETNDGCTDLNFLLGNRNAGNRDWNIKVSQYGCESPVRAPKGCTQFYYGMNDGTVESFNYNGGNGRHLANQDQSICVRRERGNCRICWYVNQPTDFAVSGMKSAGVLNVASTCGGYGMAGVGDGSSNVNFDYVHFPGARSEKLLNMAKSNRCGRDAGITANSATPLGNNFKTTSICSTQTPFLIRFRTDAWEHTLPSTPPAEDAPPGTPDIPSVGEAAQNDRGFRLSFTQDSTGC